MGKGHRLCFNENAKFMHHGQKVIICDRLTGRWIKIPKEYYEIVKLGEENELETEELLKSLYDEEDRRIIGTLIEKLNSLGVLYPYTRSSCWKEVSIALTSQCNLQCVHCIAEAGQKSVENFDTKQMYGILDKIIKIHPQNLILTGGEPMVRKDFFQLLTYIREKHNGKITLMTNGTLIHEKNVKVLVEKTDNIDISIDGADEDSCAVVRGKGVFPKAIGAVRLLQKNGMKNISLSMVLSENNKYYVKDFLELNKNLGTHPVLRYLTYEGRAKENQSYLEHKYTDRSKKYYGQEEKPVYVGCTCTAGYNKMKIEADGFIYPCEIFLDEQYRLGNVCDIEDLNQIAAQVKKGTFLAPCIAKLEPDQIELCKDCKYTYFCWHCLRKAKMLTKENFQKYCEGRKEYLQDLWDV